MFVVDDDDQSIYGWRGANVAFIRRFRRDFPDAVDIRLEENFRSTGHILAAANAIIAEDKARLGKTLFSRKGQGTPVEFMSFRDGDAEAAGLADALIARKGEGARWAEMAVLYRNNFLSRALEEALMRAKIPYRLGGDVGFYTRGETKDALRLDSWVKQAVALSFISRRKAVGSASATSCAATNCRKPAWTRSMRTPALGFDDDERDYSVAGRMLELLGIRSVVLSINNPAKLDGLARAGIEITGRVPVEATVHSDNARYLTAKATRAGHQLRHLVSSLAEANAGQSRRTAS
jgi:UvrD-like helicase C-terminal domain/GTP cyclohydrolase II/UvrD/REP helicase N-terminal domain